MKCGGKSPLLGVKDEMIPNLIPCLRLSFLDAESTCALPVGHYRSA